MKKILLVLVLALCAIAFVSCGKNSYEYPAYNDLTENPSGDYVKIGNVHFTNKEMYYYLLNQYGVDTLNEIVNKTLTTRKLTTEEEKEFTNKLNETIYGVKDPSKLDAAKKAELEAEFENEIKASGLHYTEASSNDNLYYLNYQKNQYAQYLQALDAYIESIKEADKKANEDDDEKTVEHFDESKYVSYLTSNYYKPVKALVLDFDSEASGAAMLNIAYSNDDWAQDAKTVFTSNNAVECNSYEDLAKISNVIAQKAMTFKRGEYTHYPQSYGKRFYCLYVDQINNSYSVNGQNYEVNTINFELDSEGNVTKILNETLKETIFKALCKQEFDDESKVENNQAKYWFELRQANNLKIYYEGLEVAYKKAYNAVYSALSITDFDEFKETTTGSTEKVAEWDGGSVTANDLYKALIARYGVITTFLLVRNNVVLTSKYNKVYNVETKAIQDQEAYNKLVKADISDIKEAFLAGNYTASGYPAAYGWDNFLRDYAGVLSEDAAITDLNSTLYTDVLALYKKGIYMVEDESELTVSLNGNEATVSCDKWMNGFTVTLADAKAGLTADEVKVSIIKTEDQAKACKEYTYTEKDGAQVPDLKKNDYYYHFALTYPTSSEEVTTLTKYAVDKAVMDKYVELTDATFNATVTGISAYYDKDLDGVKDENSTDETLKNFVDALWAEAKEIYSANVYENNEITNKATDADSIYDCLSLAVLKYNTANTGKWATYKNQGIRVELINEKGYTNSTEADEALIQAVKEGWNKIITKSKETGYSSIASQTIDPVYRHVYDSEVIVTTPYDFDGSTFESDNAYCHIIVISASSKTITGLEEGNEKYLPSLYYYEQNQNKTDDVTISCSNQISAYYTPAINELTSENAVNYKLMEACSKLISSIEFDSNKADNLNQLKELIEIAIKNASK